jgi:sulfate adenylyltransferase subunit 2
VTTHQTPLGETGNARQPVNSLEAEAVYILRETAAEFRRPALLYSAGKDSSVLLRLAQKAFAPGKVPFVLLHVDTSYKFAEMIEFRDQTARQLGLELIVHRNEAALAQGANPFDLGTEQCCRLLKTHALRDALKLHGIDAAIGGARREEERSRAKERIFSIRDGLGQWDPKCQRPEVWNLYNCRLGQDQTMRVFPLSNWTELDIWQYIQRERIPVVDLYFAKERQMARRNGQLLPTEHALPLHPGHKVETVMSRMRTIGCTYCSGAIRSEARTVDQIVEEVRDFRRSERENRLIDHDRDASMELKKREGYF